MKDDCECARLADENERLRAQVEELIAERAALSVTCIGRVEAQLLQERLGSVEEQHAYLSDLLTRTADALLDPPSPGKQHDLRLVPQAAEKLRTAFRDLVYVP